MKRKEIASVSIATMSMIETFFASLPEIVPHVMKHLGPYELCACLRVSVQFGHITHDVFIELAAYYLFCYGYNLSPIDYRYNAYKMDTECVLTALDQYKQGKLGWLTIYRFLSLWCHFFRTYRSYPHTVSRVISHELVGHKGVFIYNRKEKCIASINEWENMKEDNTYSLYAIATVNLKRDNTPIIDYREIVCLIEANEEDIPYFPYMYMNSVQNHCLYLTTDPVTRVK